VAVVALRALGLGDLLTAVPALRGIAQAFPGERHLLAAPAALAPLALATGAVHAVVDTPFGAGVGRRGRGPGAPLARALHCAVAAVNLHGKGPQSHRLLLATGPRRLIAYAHPAVHQSRGGPVWRDDEHEVARWCRLLRHAGLPADPGRLQLEPPPGPTPAVAVGATLLHPGAASTARCWPAQRWAAVARSERRAGRRVVITGGPHEVALAGGIAAAAGLGADAVLAGQSDVGELARVVRAAARVVCGDTGVGHLATAVGTPSVLLFGPTDPARWGPPARIRRHRVLWAGRTGDPHGNRPDPGLLAIGVDEVLDALAQFEGRSPETVPRPGEAGISQAGSPR
jgi:ADP-heptose:LPS heptosyltransferase